MIKQDNIFKTGHLEDGPGMALTLMQPPTK